MARIIAKGETYLGNIEAVICGEKAVETISTGDQVLDEYFREQIKAATGSLANGFYPESNTMLQAYAFCLTLFDYQDITIEGDIGEIEYEDGVVY